MSGRIVIVRALLLRLLVASGLLPWTACGGGAEPAPVSPEPAAAAPATTGSDTPSPSEDEGFEVQGTLGTLDEGEVSDAVSRRFRGFLACFSQRMGDVELLAGDVTFAFHVVADGSVDRATLVRSTVGDRATERCLTEEAMRVRFPRPRGGTEAEVQFPFGLELAEDLRPPVFWDGARVRTEALAEGPAARERCEARGAIELTAYVAPGGEVLAVGGASPSAEADGDALDCVAADVVERWELPDPGSYPAKVTFELP